MLFIPSCSYLQFIFVSCGVCYNSCLSTRTVFRFCVYNPYFRLTWLYNMFGLVVYTLFVWPVGPWPGSLCVSAFSLIFISFSFSFLINYSWAHIYAFAVICRSWRVSGLGREQGRRFLCWRVRCLWPYKALLPAYSVKCSKIQHW